MCSGAGAGVSGRTLSGRIGLGWVWGGFHAEAIPRPPEPRGVTHRLKKHVDEGQLVGNLPTVREGRPDGRGDQP